MINSRGDMNDTSWPERALLAGLILVSILLFWGRLGRVLDRIRRSRATPDFALAPVGWRVRQFVTEIALQAKVIAQRPLPGLAHAFVFWGFCAFALITINHL